MFSSIRKIITIIFTLVSFGIIFNTSPVLADTTSPDQADSNTADDQVTYKISGFEMPYTTLVSKSSKISRHYWLPKPESEKSVKMDDFNEDVLLAPYKNDPDPVPGAIIESLPEAVSLYRQQSKPITASPNATLADVLQSLVPFPSNSDYISIVTKYAIARACLTRDSVLYQKDPKEISFDQFEQDYEEYIKPAVTDPQAEENFSKVFSNEETLKSSLQNMSTDPVKTRAIVSRGLYGVSQSDLGKIDLKSTETLIKDALNQPFTDYLIPQDDGTYYVKGNIVFPQSSAMEVIPYPDSKSYIQPYIYSLGGIPTATTNPTPTPATSQPVTIHYVDSTGKTLKPDKTLTGSLGSHYTATPLAITGYTLSQTTGEETGTFDTTAKTITYTYTKDPLADVGGLAPKNTVIYATKKIGLYRQATFTKQARKQWYAKKSRINRPMFVVTGYAKSKNGVKRYHVKDVNHSSKTNGQTGYVTANAKYVAHVYYATKHQRVTVINPRGVNAYSQKDLTGQAAHYQQGQVLKVKRIVRHNLTTRFVLSNGHYITANKSLVQAGKVTMPSRVRAKGALNRYTDVQLTRKSRHYSKKASATFTIKGWAYTNANNFGKRDTLRYRVAGGYITGNRHLITVVK